MRRVILALLMVPAVCLVMSAQAGQAKPTPNPVLVFDTAKGTFEIELFASETPKSVAHILALMKRNVYRGQRFHRVESALVQWGDPQSRDMRYRANWGSGSVGEPVGVFEWAKKRSNLRAAVGLAHRGNPANATSQLFIWKTDQSGNDGKYAIVGRVTTGMAVVDKIAVEDMIKNATVK